MNRPGPYCTDCMHSEGKVQALMIPATSREVNVTMGVAILPMLCAVSSYIVCARCCVQLLAKHGDSFVDK